MSSLTPSQRLIARLRVQGLDLPEDTVVERIYTGRWMRARGAWSWHLATESGTLLPFGSQWRVTELLRCPHEWQVEGADRYVTDRSIDPCDSCARILWMV